MTDTTHWGGDEWHAEHIDNGFVKLTRCRDGPSALQLAGDSVCISASLLPDGANSEP